MNKRADFLHVWHVELPVALGVFGLISLTVLVALVVSHARRNRQPSQSSSHPRIEAVYAAAVAALATFIVVLSLTANATSASPHPAARVQITAFQWCWRFHYGNTSASVTGTCLNGRAPTFEVPTGQVIHFSVTSTDVVHSFWVPSLDFKMAAFPHHINSFNMTVERPGRYVGRCAEFCGEFHYAMDFTMVAVSPARFHRWLHAQERI